MSEKKPVKDNTKETKEPPKDSKKEPSMDDIKSELKTEIKKQLKQEILDEISKGLKMEEQASKPADMKVEEHKEVPNKQQVVVKVKEETFLSVRAFLKIASHALKYANEKIPADKWVEVIGLLAGKIDEDGNKLYIEDAYPMGHGNAVYAEIKDYKNFVRAFNDLKAKGYFMCGWYHSHPSYGLFMSDEDLGTQGRYQKLWNKSVGLVIDPYMIDGKNLGFNIFRADVAAHKWYAIPFSMKGSLSPNLLPDLLEFISPIIDGKALYLEYDEA
jgi:proteasome lid subunit RPN8/RPN11